MKKKIIIINGILLFVLACFIAFLILSKETADDEEIVESKEKYVAAKSGLNLRSGANKSSKVITLIPFGAMVTIEKSEDDEIFLDGRYGKWVNVKHGNKTGWVFSGFLCDFKPDTVIKFVADYYREVNDYYKEESLKDKEKYEGMDIPNDYDRYDYNEVTIEEILDNYIVLIIPYTNVTGRNYLGQVWKYDAKQENFFIAYSHGGHNTPCILYLDNDKYPDLVIQSGWDGASDIDILLGSKEGFEKIYDRTKARGYLYSLSIGSCGNMKFARKEFNDKTKISTMNYYRLNCNKRKIEKYAVNIIGDSKGVITSIDWKNLSIVIKDNKDSKDALLKIPADYKSYHKESFGGLYIEYLEKLKVGDEVSFSYEIINDKKVVREIDRWQV